jgi:hypothetical protein
VQEGTDLVFLEVITLANLAVCPQEEGWEKLAGHSIFLLVGWFPLLVCLEVRESQTVNLTSSYQAEGRSELSDQV